MTEEISVDTSSIGPTWPPKESSFKRIKGFNTTGIIADPQTFETMIKTLADLSSQIENSDINRISVRAVVSNPILDSCKLLLSRYGEVVIPLAGTQPDLNDSSIVYFAYNSETRQSDENDLSQAFKNVYEAIKKPSQSPLFVMQRAIEQGYVIQVLNLGDSNGTGDEVTKQMSELYSRFGWTEDDVADILGKKNNIIAVAAYQGRIVSAGIAETLSLSLGDGHKLRMAEITEAATDSEHTKKGLYSAVAAELMLGLYKKSKSGDLYGGEIDLIYGECNGNAPGVLKSAKMLGRTFAIEYSRSNNLPVKGFLSQHVPIAGAERSTPHNDLFPAYMSRETLYCLFEK